MMDSLRDLLWLVYDFWARDSCRTVTSVMGTIFLVYLFISIARIVVDFVRPSNLPIYLHSESGSWALVTGASDGIGQAFAAELLNRGFNVLLHGRNQSKLERVKAELQALHSKQVDIVVADASGQDDNYKIVTRKVEQLPGRLTMLVNNVCF